MKKIAIVGIAVVLSICLAACGTAKPSGSVAGDNSASTSTAASASAATSTSDATSTSTAASTDASSFATTEKGNYKPDVDFDSIVVVDVFSSPDAASAMETYSSYIDKYTINFYYKGDTLVEADYVVVLTDAMASNIQAFANGFSGSNGMDVAISIAGNTMVAKLNDITSYQALSKDQLISNFESKSISVTTE